MTMFWFVIIACSISSAQKNGALRLKDGNETAGRVEIYLDYEWGTICNDFWDFRDATVVCRQLGFEEALRPFVGVLYGNGHGIIHLDDVDCYGSETSLMECSYSINHDCMHHEDVGVQCKRFDYFTPQTLLSLASTMEPCRNDCTGDVRLGDGKTAMGLAEVCVCETWGTVCHDEWSQKVSQVLCRQIGFKSFYGVRPRPYFPTDQKPRPIYKIECFGNESQLLSCPFIQESNCEHQEDAIISCVPYEKGDIRLVGGNETAGRVEVFLDGQWGTVCDDFWDIKDASVICHQLGFRSALRALKNAHFGEGDGPIHVETVECLGNEPSLLRCEYKRDTDCRHHEDAGVTCNLHVDINDQLPTTEEQPLVTWLVVAAFSFGAVILTAVTVLLIGRYHNNVKRNIEVNKNVVHRSVDFDLRPLPAFPRRNFQDSQNCVPNGNFGFWQEATDARDQSRSEAAITWNDDDNFYYFISGENQSLNSENYVPMSDGNRDDNRLYETTISIN